MSPSGRLRWMLMTWGSGIVVGSVIDKSWLFKNIPSETFERMMESFFKETQSEASLVFFHLPSGYD